MISFRKIKTVDLVSFFISLFVLILISGKPVYAQSGGFLNLDGTNDRFEAVTTIFPKTSNVQSFTVDAWIYPTERASQFIATDYAYDLLVRYNSAAANNGLGITFTIWGTGGYRAEKTEYRDITLNQWNHIVGMFNAESLPNPQLTIAINGKISLSPLEFGDSSFFTDPDQQFAVGGWPGDDYINFRGHIDEVRVSDAIRYNGDFNSKYYHSFSCDGYTKALFHFDGPDGSLSTISDCNLEYILTATGDAHITNRPARSMPWIPLLLLDDECTDGDLDGYYAEASCGTEVDCNDSDELINPDEAENCFDGVDNDCDGYLDGNDSECKTNITCCKCQCEFCLPTITGGNFGSSCADECIDVCYNNPSCGIYILSYPCN
jgi:hypothetical protein